jgi:hypothetical protein
VVLGVIIENTIGIGTDNNKTSRWIERCTDTDRDIIYVISEVVNLSFLQNMWAVASDRVLVNLSITSKGTTSYCTELKQHNVDKTHIGELVKMCLRKID